MNIIILKDHLDTSIHLNYSHVPHNLPELVMQTIAAVADMLAALCVGAI